MFKRLLLKYNASLIFRPYKTHAITSGLLWMTGDLLSQRLDPSKSEPSKIDWRRASIMTAFGFTFAGLMLVDDTFLTIVLLIGPAYAFWYTMLDTKLTPWFMARILSKPQPTALSPYIQSSHSSPRTSLNPSSLCSRVESNIF